MSASDPLFRPLHTQGTDETFTSLLIGEDLDHISPSFDLSVESFQQVGRPDTLDLTRFGGYLISSLERRPTMLPTRPPYPAELKRQMVELVRAGRSPSELAREFEPTAQTIQNLVRQADRDEGLRQDGLKSDEREELRRLRRENKQLRIEREILSKAAAWFAAETDANPRKSSRL